MERPILDIPGYYYDPEKKKYFKIQTGSATPASSAYSSSDVKRRKTRDHAAEVREALFLRQRGQIRRAKLYHEALLGGQLERAHGRRWGMSDPQIYAEGLIHQGTLSPLTQFSVCNDPLFDVEHRTDLGDGIVDVRMVFDDQIWTIRANVDKYTRSQDHGSVEICHNYGPSAINRASWRLERFGHPGAATSLTMHHESRTAAFTWLSGVNHSGVAIIPMSGIPTDADADRPTILLAAGGEREVNVWSSTAAPNVSEDLFAFGTSDGIFAVNKERCDPRTICPTLSDWSNAPREVLSLEYLSDNPSVLLSGSRSGILNIIDTRLPFSGSDIIVHPSGITHIKQIDPHRILVAGLASSMCQYDLRFRKVDTPANLETSPNKSKKPHSKHAPKSHQRTKRSSTRPTLTYPRFRNNGNVRIGLDVDLESGLIAAGQQGDDETAQVEIFSLHGGQRLKTKVAERCAFNHDTNQSNQTSSCVKWVEDGYGKGRSLWVGIGKDAKRFAWGTWEEGQVDYDR